MQNNAGKLGLALTGAIRTVVHELDPTLVVDRLQTQTSVVQRVFWRERLQRNVTAGFAATALLLMVFGMYGVIAYTTGQRIPEFGIRRALGASAADIATLVLATGARLAAAGIGAGLLATLALLSVLRRLMSGVESADSLTAIGVALAVLVIIVASALPAAARAIRLDPIRAIRGE